MASIDNEIFVLYGAEDVHKVSVPRNEASLGLQLSVDAQLFGLSTTSDHNVLGAYHDSGMIDEYTTDGVHIQRIPSRTVSPRDELRPMYYSPSSSPSLQIDVYNASTFVVVRFLSIKMSYSYNCYSLLGNIPMYGFTACSYNRCLYISYPGNCLVHKVPVRENETSFQWPVNAQPSGLSTTSDHNVLVACDDSWMIDEYTTDGVHIRQIPSPTVSPLSVVQLSSGHYGVIHRQPAPGYSVLNASGQVAKSYKGQSDVYRAKFIRQERMQAVLSTPYALTVIRPGKVLIADQSNNRLLALTEKDNSFVAEWLPETVYGGLKQPCCLYFDVSKKRLYISEFGGSRVLCYGM